VPPPVAPPAPAAAEPVQAEPTEAELKAAEGSIQSARVWLSRLHDPLASVTLRRFQPGLAKPMWGAELPFLLAGEREALPGTVRGRFELALIWEQVAADWKAGRDPAPRAAALRELADRFANEDPALAGQGRFDARLLEWSGKGLPEGEASAAIPEARIWRAHTLAAAGDDQDAAEVLRGVADFAAQPGAEVLVEDALLAVRAADQCLAQAVAEIRDKTGPEVVPPGTGRAVRDPAAAYAQAVNRLRDPVAAAVQSVVAVARATSPAVAAELKARLERARAGAAPGDRVWSLAELDATPWRDSRAAWTERTGRLPAEEAAILAHLLGRVPVPARAEDLPVARLRGTP
jgi:hypothetical protein